MESENCRRLKDIYPQVYHFYFTEQQPEWMVVHHHSINSPQIVRRKERNPVPIVLFALNQILTIIMQINWMIEADLALSAATEIPEAIIMNSVS